MAANVVKKMQNNSEVSAFRHTHVLARFPNGEMLFKSCVTAHRCFALRECYNVCIYQVVFYLFKRAGIHTATWRLGALPWQSHERLVAILNARL
jgi:hypothetical protein